MTAEKFFVMRHPEFRRRTEQELREKDRTDFDDVIAVVPYKNPEYPGGQDYNRRKPLYSDECIKYDHSITQNVFSEKVPDVVLDVVEIAVATFAADKAVGREMKIEDELDDSLLDTRNIKIQIPVLSSAMASEEVEQMYSDMVSHMTRDVVEFEFLHVEPEEPVDQYSGGSGFDAVSLLSDGLDSAAGVFHNESQNRDSFYSTVNYGQGAGSKAEKIVEETGIDHQTCRVQYDGRGESTQFSRGLLHLSFGAMVAAGKGIDEVQSFENGIVARFLILSEGWMTTRTVSPLFLAYFNQILNDVLEHTVEVSNPFKGLTKTEIVNKIPDTEVVQQTISCPHSSRVGGENCGLCVPCLIRNIGIIASNHNIPVDELSKYDALTKADFEHETLDVDIRAPLKSTANNREIFFKGAAEIAYFCRRIINEAPQALGTEYPQLLDKTIYDQHQRFANNFVDAMETVKSENTTVKHLLPDN